ncbi:MULTISPECIES: YhdP family protein [unclassified Lysobacter]
MPTALRRRLRHARRGFGYVVAVTLVLVALVLGLASQVLPLAERNPDQVAAWLSQRAGRPVAFDAVETAWTRRGPLLQLENLRIGEGEQAFAVGDTEMLVSIYAGLLPGVPLSELRLRNLELTVERLADGRWQVRGLPGQQQSGGDPFQALEGLGELQVIDGALRVLAADVGVDITVPRVDLRLQVDADQVRAGLRAWPQAVAGEVATPIDSVLAFNRHSGDGRAYADADRVDLAEWSPLLQLAGVAIQGGQGSVEAWMTLRDKRVAMVTLDTLLEDVTLSGAPVALSAAVDARAQGAAVPVARLERFEARARWQQVDGGWRLDAPALRVDADSQQHVFDGLLLAGGDHYALVADRVDLAPLAHIAALSDRLPAPLRRWLLQARPSGALRQVELHGRRDGSLAMTASVEGLEFKPVADSPGLRGLAGRLEGDASGFSLRLDKRQPVQFDWPRGFGMVHEVRLDGTITGWREGDGWQAGTAGLRVDGEDFGADARGSLWWQGDGTRPRIDLAATVDETAVPVAKKFWVRHKMPESLVEWLDGALVGGTVVGGRALISGDLDDWPFVDNDGRFEARARITDASVAFHEGWPAASGLDLDASFIGNGFSLDGRGTLAAIEVPAIHAAIDDYGDGALTVEASSNADIGQLIGLLQDSPLHELQPETFDAITGSGAAKTDFRLVLPMGHGEFSIQGAVALSNAKLADPRWDLAFDAVNGRVRYSRNGFSAPELRVRHDGRAGTLSLRAGEGLVRHPGNIFEGKLVATFGSDALLQRAPELGWLAPYMDGRSQWSVELTVPKSAAGQTTATRLRLESDLRGTALSLPEPLAKPAGEVLATSVETPLPLGSGEIQVALGDVLALRARTVGGSTGVRVALGSRVVQQAAPASGLVVSGRADIFDAIGWVGMARGGGTGNSAMALRRMDVTARRLHLLGGNFPHTRLLAEPVANGATRVRFEGEALQGDLLVPPAAGAAVTGSFQRVYWQPVPSPTPAPSSTSTAAGTTGTADAIDPRRIPPLSLDIADLGIGDARLGTALVRTHSMANGLQLERLQVREPGQSIDASGSWTGTGATARTELSAKLQSEDLGQLLADFGFAGRLEGGAGSVQMDAGWAGGPAQFGLASLAGRLHLDVRDGRLLEVEPGAGRVLGLLSLAELPRRLTLDFGDFFFKGFAFNQAGGDIRFAGGEASSDNLRIDGPAARINIHGSANLRAKTFNQTIEVLPRTGTLLTVAGALAAGPVGAAIGAAANAVLQKPLGQINAKTYRVTGPWSDPKVEVISREQGRVADKPVPSG